MVRPFALLLLLSLPLAAEEDYESIIADAYRLRHTLREGDTADVPLDRAYDRLADAAILQPHRWEAFAERAINRCRKTIVVRKLLLDLLNESRARGRPQAEMDQHTRYGYELIRHTLQQAYDDFRKMERNMRRLGVYDPGWTKFAGAMMKYAKGEYEETETGDPGAIQDFKELIRSGWRAQGLPPQELPERVASCYVQLGTIELAEGRYGEAQKRWDEALRWAQTDETRRIIYTNKAGAFERDNEYGLAEKILRDQIEREPHRPIHWKNLGLVLGYQNRVREALDAYRRARELCREAGEEFHLSLFHGNAWLKAAMIHGKLLEEDGDIRLAWRLFLEYREFFGDDYNFCFNFGDFAFHMGAYDLAWAFLTRARDLQPFCPPPYQLILNVAPRTGGTPEEVRDRIAKAQAEFELARERYLPREQTESMKRQCGGLRDVGEDGRGMGTMPLIEPDPLAGFGPDSPPAWVEAVAAKRAPFRPYDPALDDDAGEAPAVQPGGEADEGGGVSVILVAVVALAALAGAVFLFRRG